MAKILVTGGTGELGSSLVPRLRRAGYTVRIMSRRPAPPDLAQGVEWATADLATGAGLVEAVARVTEIIHAASQPFKQTRAIDVEGTSRLIQAAKKAHVDHFFYISIVGVDRIPISYCKHKMAAERIVEESDLNWSILRVLVLVAGLFYTLNGLALLVAPTWFFENVGAFAPFNRHYLGDKVYAILAGYRDHHPHILPEAYFTRLELEAGGTGAGTVFKAGLKMLVQEQSLGRGSLEKQELVYVRMNHGSE